MLSDASRAIPPPMVTCISIISSKENRAQRNGSPGGEFTYAISSTASPPSASRFSSTNPLWKPGPRKTAARSPASEEYAVAKMRLFQAFDEGVVKPPAQGQPGVEVAVDDSNLETLLEQLGI